MIPCLLKKLLTLRKLQPLTPIKNMVLDFLDKIFIAVVLFNYRRRTTNRDSRILLKAVIFFSFSALKSF